ncbi:MAG TPA: 16S rRNA (guanine(527)-N(7))-methyltransferase RsmG, partial [Bacteroidetes bacterium]|nr:16S rRNA (guanine(527)-N(7))-methyltransferase RsmG [Bacteroidota bacterium]
MDEILRYFPDLSPAQRERFAAMGSLYAQWNARINVISRQDTEHFYLHHVLHSLAIARVVDFAPGARILDAGTGGGFPGIPLAVLFPQVHFTLVDSIGKKTKVAADIAGQLSLENVSVVNARIESLPEQYDFVVSRAVARMEKIVAWTRGKIRPGKASS